MSFTTSLIKRTFLTLALAASLLVAGQAFASSGDNVTGFAWSANIGWISFNCTSQPGGCTATPGGFEGGGGDIPGADETDIGDIGFLGKDNSFALGNTPAVGGFLSKIVQKLSQAFPAGILRTAPALADDVTGYGSSYGVSVDPATGNFSGYAWSPYIGWISFNEYTGCPEGSCTPHLNLGSGEITGWAKALAATGTSGWDGWISLSCKNATGLPWCLGVSYGANLDFATKIVSGYSWGDDVIGWVNFDGPTYEVMIDLEQPLVTLAASSPTFCPDTATTLTWNSVGTTSCTASSTNADPAFTGPIPTSGTATVNPSAPSTTYTISCLAPGTDEAYQSSVTVSLGDCGSDLILSAEPAPAQCTAGYRTNFTLYSPTSTSYTSCTALVPSPLGAPTIFTGKPNAANGYLVTIPDVLVASNPTNFSVSCTAEGTGVVDTATTSVARACAAPFCEFTEGTLSGDPLKANLTWTSTGGTGTGLTASGGWTGTKAFNGTQEDVSFTAPATTYNLKVTNPDGLQYTCSTTLDSDCTDGDCNVVAEVNLTADPMSITLGEGETGDDTVLTWTSSNIVPDTCVAYSWPDIGSWSEPKDDEGSDTVFLSTSTTFRVQCEDAGGGYALDDVTVSVTGTPPPPPPVCTDPTLCPTVRTKPWYIER